MRNFLRRRDVAVTSRLRRPICLVAALALSPSLAACASDPARLNIVAVERAVAQSILIERHIYATVSCPPKVPRRAGYAFSCMATLTVGTYPVRVTEVDGNGHVRYANPAPLVILNITSVQNAIKRSIRAQRRLDAKVSCPTEVIQQAGVVFTCTATVTGRPYGFTVTEVDGNGHVRYVGT